MLLRDFELTISLPACNPSAQTLNATAQLSDDIGEVLPYLNAVVKGAIFNPESGILRFAHDGWSFTVYRDRVAIGRVADAGEAREAMEWLKGLINETYEGRHALQPSYRRGMELNPLQVYKLLPGGNCKECGEATCFAFAARLLREELEVISCQPLFRPEHQEKRERLLALLREAGRL